MEAIGRGERADVAIMTDEAVDELVEQGILAGVRRIGLADAVLGLAVRKGAIAPDISTNENFRKVSSLLPSKTEFNGRTEAALRAYATLGARLRELRWKNSAWLATAETIAGWNGFEIRNAGSGRSPVRKRSG
jgi:hypothetical protein